MINNLTRILDFQAQALTLRSERQRLLASNIANADTPGYKSRDMDFAQALRDATGQQGFGQGHGILHSLQHDDGDDRAVAGQVEGVGHGQGS